MSDAERLGRLPAQYGREVLRSMARSWLIAIGILLGVALVAGFSSGWTSIEFVISELVVLGVMWGVFRWVEPELDRREQGNDGELKVAGILDELHARGWRSLHDVQTGRGNIDHVVVGPNGVVTIETKSHRGYINVDSINPAWLRQAYAQRKWLERVIGQPVDSLLVFSDARLSRGRARRRGVCVLPARGLSWHLNDCETRLSADEVDTLHQRLAAALD